MAVGNPVPPFLDARLSLNGVQLNGVQLNGTLFSARADSGQSLSGEALVGTTFSVEVTEAGEQVAYQLKLGAMYLDSQSPSGDVYLYDVQYKRADAPQWGSLCTDVDGNPVPAIPLRNHWNTTTGARVDDPSAVTFACTNGALAKCVRWGYRPWASGTRCTGNTCSQISLADHHQACTRMVRADYCGNGQSYTVDGTAIDVFDNLSPHIQARGTSWRIEAKWTPNGATCLGKTRAKALIDGFKYPSCSGAQGGDEFEKCDNDDYHLPYPNLLGNGFAG